VGRGRDRKEGAALLRTQVAPGEAEPFRAAWVSSVSDRWSMTDCEAAQGVVLEKLGAPGLMCAEVDEIIVEVARDREGVDQEQCLHTRFSLLVHFR
jgi:hypothetical protein